MCINVACCADVAVTQPLLNLLQAHAIGIEQAGATMAQVVKADFSSSIWMIFRIISILSCCECFLHLHPYYSILKAACMFEFQQGGLLCKNICLFYGTAPFLPGLPTMRFCPSCTVSVQRQSPGPGAPTFSVPEIPRRSWGLCCPAPPL